MNEIVLIKQALNSSKIMDESPDMAKKFLIGVITRVYIMAGQAASKEILEFMANELCKDLYCRFKGLTLKEVELALSNGAKGLYGEYYGINIRSFNQFLNDYVFSEERRTALEEENIRVDTKKQIAVKGTRTTEEIEQMDYTNALDLFEEYKRTKECPDYGNVVYNYLDRLGLIQFSVEEKWQMMDEARNSRERERKERAVSIVNVIDKMQEGGVLVVYAKRIALKRYFRGLVENGNELKTILDNLKT